MTDTIPQPIDSRGVLLSQVSHDAGEHVERRAFDVATGLHRFERIRQIAIGSHERADRRLG
ncbi:hypothetical protein [Caballeronia sordidicola]|uniref:hypothetical protein n=1 Tax=Caballeronia sordidicola TaxID=196367 RepID=UPI001177FC30